MFKKYRLATLAVAACIGMSFFVGCSNEEEDSKKRINQAEYFNMEVSAQDSFALVINGEVILEKGITIDKKNYINVEDLRTYLNDKFFYDKSEQLVIYTLPSAVLESVVGKSSYSMEGKEYELDYPISILKEEKLYIALDFVKEHTAMEVLVYEKPNRVVIDNIYDDVLVANVTKDTVIRKGESQKEVIIADVKKDEEVRVSKKGNGYINIYTKDGFSGYIKSDELSTIKKETKKATYNPPIYTDLVKDYKINLVWHYMEYSAGNSTLEEKLATTNGVNVVSPTWFKLSDNQGGISSLASYAYVKDAKKLGCEVWALINDFDKNSEGEYYIKNILPSTKARRNLITNLIAEVKEYKIQGINLDFEHIPSALAAEYVQFVRELSIECRKNGIVFSIDNYSSVKGTSYYNRKAQGEVADYIVIMSYDEHWSTSPTAGSVASLPFVKEGIDDTLKEVPARKVINALPFYTRIWKETPEALSDGTKEVVIDPVFGNYTLSSNAVGMKTAMDEIILHNATPMWLEELGQNYAEYVVDEIRHRVWLEDEMSLRKKMELVKELNLAGVAGWRLGLQDDSYTWDVIEEFLK